MKLEDYKTNTKPLDMGPIIESIRRLSESLGVDYNELTDENYNASPKRYHIPVDIGDIETEGLFKHPEIAVATTHIKANTRMTKHTHDELEIVKMLEGEMCVTVDNNEMRLVGKGEVILFHPNMPHEAFWPVDSACICITMPACSNWPEVGEI